MLTMRRLIRVVGAIVLLALSLAAAVASDKYPEKTADGLDRVKSKNVDAAYRKEGASLADYNRVRIGDVSVSFRKNWLRDQNRDRRSVSDKVTSEDMDNIRSALAQLFREEFTEELEKGGYEVVAENGADVLFLEPAIVDLDVNAPDVSMRQPGITRTYTTSAGEMTLNLDLRDSTTNALIGRAIDRREDRAVGTIQYSNSITNRADAKRILRSWASALRKALDDAHEPQ
jgi:hypothetical protein